MNELTQTKLKSKRNGKCGRITSVEKVRLLAGVFYIAIVYFVNHFFNKEGATAETF